MHHDCQPLVDFIRNTAVTPDGTCASTEVPADVAAVLEAKEIAVGTFLSIFALVKNLLGMFGSGDAKLGDFMDAILELIKALKPKT